MTNLHRFILAAPSLAMVAFAAASLTAQSFGALTAQQPGRILTMLLVALAICAISAVVLPFAIGLALARRRLATRIDFVCVGLAAVALAISVWTLVDAL